MMRPFAQDFQPAPLLATWPQFQTVTFQGDIGPVVLLEHTCAYARWAHVHRFLSVRLSVTGPKFRLLPISNQLSMQPMFFIVF